MYLWEVTVEDEDKKTDVIPVQAWDILNALSAAQNEAKGKAVVAVKRLQAVPTKDPKRPLPKVLAWADKVADKLRPGFMAHAIAQDGSTLVQKLMDGNNIDWVRNELTTPGTASWKLCEEAYPNGFMVRWVPQPDFDFDLIALRLMADHAYDFEPQRQCASPTWKMVSRRLRKTVGFIINRIDLKSYYATTVPNVPEENDLLPDPPYADPAQAVNALHQSFYTP